MDQECTIFDLIIEDRITQMARMGDCAYAKTKGKFVDLMIEESLYRGLYPLP